jgi:hypothetical protein
MYDNNAIDVVGDQTEVVEVIGLPTVSFNGEQVQIVSAPDRFQEGFYTVFMPGGVILTLYIDNIDDIRYGEDRFVKVKSICSDPVTGQKFLVPFELNSFQVLGYTPALVPSKEALEQEAVENGRTRPAMTPEEQAAFLRGVRDRS